MKKILIIDNYDSFTYNLVQYTAELGAKVEIYFNNSISLKGIKKINPDGIIISPGPGNPTDPKDFGVCSEVIRTLGKTKPILGVCLGHQGIIAEFGGEIIKAPKPIHGKKSQITHNQSGIFKDIQTPCEVMRYHSLIGNSENFPHEHLEITAETTKDKLIMGIKHREFEIHGIQFHPESIGTKDGKKMIENFLKLIP